MLCRYGEVFYTFRGFWVVIVGGLMIRVRGYASKYAHSHVIPWLIDWLGRHCLYFFFHFS